MLPAAFLPAVAARFKVLGEPARLEILALLQKGEKSVTEIVEGTGRSQPNVSQHLSQLARGGLVKSRRDGTRVLYRISDPFVVELCRVVCSSIEEKLEAEREALGLARSPRKG
jgi:DNA-binding transcriptional ArsR family regulator